MQTYSKFWHIQNSVYSDIFRHIQAYSTWLRHININWVIIKRYLGLLRYIQNPVYPLHIHNLAVFWALVYLEPETFSKPCETLTRHVQNLAIARTIYSGIIQPYSGILWTLCNLHICRNFAYLEFQNIQNPSIIASQCLFKTLYLGEIMIKWKN